jgi:hypothetical protein
MQGKGVTVRSSPYGRATYKLWPKKSLSFFLAESYSKVGKGHAG